MTVKTPAVIVDMDGTLTVNGDRSPYDYSRVSEDRLNLPVGHTARALRRAGYAMLVVSGRSASCRVDTLAWLRRWVETDFPDDQLFMRADGDYRPDDQVKFEIYRKFIRPEYDVMCVLDDRDKVVKMWRREAGLTCLQVNYGDF